MKRYSHILDKNLDGNLYIRIYQADNGEWVKYEDVKHLIGIYEACEKVTSAFREGIKGDK